MDDWATKAAKQIVKEAGVIYGTEESVAAVIATFAEPLVALLRELRREHSVQCHVAQFVNVNNICTCGADAWNARVDAMLKGEE